LAAKRLKCRSQPVGAALHKQKKPAGGPAGELNARLDLKHYYC
jgi:hypothetical protein